MIDLISKITAITEEKFLEEDFRDCYILEVKISKNLRVEVFVDSDSGMTINKCTSISRYIGKILEEEDLISSKYTLEVSSPGVDRPLVKRQYNKHIGRFVMVKLKNNTSCEGQMTSVNEDGIVLEIYDKKEHRTISIAFDEIHETKIILKFNKKQK